MDLGLEGGRVQVLGDDVEVQPPHAGHAVETKPKHGVAAARRRPAAPHFEHVQHQRGVVWALEVQGALRAGQARDDERVALCLWELVLHQHA